MRIVDPSRREKRALVTLDLDFADIRNHPPDEYFGLVVLRLHRQDKRPLTAVVRRLLAGMPDEPLERRLWIVEETRVRVRG